GRHEIAFPRLGGLAVESQDSGNAAHAALVLKSGETLQAPSPDALVPVQGPVSTGNLKGQYILLSEHFGARRARGGIADPAPRSLRGAAVQRRRRRWRGPCEPLPPWPAGSSPSTGSGGETAPSDGAAARGQVQPP